MVTGMGGDRARQALAGTRFADLRRVAETGSTNRDLLAAAADGAADGVVLVADHQTAGRGRLDRSWVAPPGSSVLMSVLLRPDLGAGDAHLLTTALAVGAAEACGGVAGVDVRIKWPNDLVVAADDHGGVRKVAGILAESSVERGRLSAVVVGIGLNVNWPARLPADLESIAVALNHVAGHDIDRDDLIVATLAGLERWCAPLSGDDDGRGAGQSVLMAEARSRSATLGRRVRAEIGAETVEGTAQELSEAGELVVETAEGRRTIIAGDVVHLRTVD
jgi:BirA family transcriptional regulator, biotin operon repressor / biotin---[acetyl-CoA-carboxylase] ligase